MWLVVGIMKQTHRNESDKKNITNRINRIIGQMNGIKNMIMENRYCDDVLMELSAIEKSIQSLSNLILEKHLYSCVSTSIENGNLEILDELVSIFKRFNK